jgi:hypothetical protein
MVVKKRKRRTGEKDRKKNETEKLLKFFLRRTSARMVFQNVFLALL